MKGARGGDGGGEGTTRRRGGMRVSVEGEGCGGVGGVGIYS